jgi:hypothetical protein
MKPNLETLDTIIDKYAELRRSGSCEKAFEAVRFSVHSKVEYFQTTEAFRHIGCVARSYAKLSRMMSRPRCGMELPLALSTICLSIASMYFAPPALAGREGLTSLLISTNGSLLFIYIVRKIAGIWCEFRVRAAIYDELAEMACQESGQKC